MDQAQLTGLEPPRIVEGKTLLIAGMGKRYTAETSVTIPELWNQFGPHINHVRGQIGHASYGVIQNGDGKGNIEYVCGVEVSDLSRIPPDWTQVRIPEQRYAVFTHRKHVSFIRRTWDAIYREWLPQSGFALAATPEFELYDERFDPMTGNGSFEIWIPIKEKLSTEG